MSSVNRVNISSIKDYYQNFMQEKDNFDHVSYKTFSYSYLTKCSDSSVVKMKNELNEIYKKICNGYSNIERWWDSYIYDICETERSLSNENKLGNVKEGSVRSYINSQLPHLENFNIKFSENFNSGQLKRIDNKIFITNNVVSGSQKDIFFDLYQEYDVGNNNAKRVIFDDQSYEQNEAMTFIGTKMTSWILNKKNEINDFFDDINSSNAKEVVANKLSEKMQNIPNLLFQTGSFVSNNSRSLLDKASNLLNEMIEPMTNYFSNIFTKVPTHEETSSQITYEQLVDNFGVPTTLFLLSGAYMTNEIESAWNATTGWVNDLSNSVSQFFSDTCATISNGAQNLWNNVSGWVDDASNSVSQFFSDTYATISNGAQILWGNIDDWWNNSALPWFESAHENVVNTLNSAGAWIDGQITSGLNGLGQFFTNTGKTVNDIFNDIINGDFVGALASVGALGLSFEEGIFQFGEALYDTSSILTTSVASVFTGAFDLANMAFCSITNSEYVSATEIMWNDTKAFVSQTHVTNLFNWFYDNTFVGNFISENSYDFENIRSVGNGIGYTTGIVALTVATFGLGSAAGAAGGATTGLTSGSVTAGQLSLVAGLSGMGRGTETAWNNGASLTEGLLAGGLTGLWEGLQFYVGSKIGGTNIFNGTNKITNNFLNSSMRMILDGIDGGVEGFVQPLINLVYTDGYYDEFGNYIEFTSEDNFFERYKQVFDDNGGFSAVFVNAAVGTGSSFLGEIFDVGKFFKDKDNKIQIDDQKLPKYESDLSIKNSQDVKISNDKLIVSISTLNEQLELSNSGQLGLIYVDSLEQIPIDFWDSNVKNPNLFYIATSTKNYTFDEAKKIMFPDINTNKFDTAGVDYDKINNTVNAEVKFKNREEAAIYFNDPKMFLVSKIDYYLNKYQFDAKAVEYLNQIKRYVANKSSSRIDLDVLYNSMYQYLEFDDKKIIDDILGDVNNIHHSLSKEEKLVIENYTGYGGPAVSSYLREQSYIFNGRNANYVDKEVASNYLYKVFSHFGRLKEISSSFFDIDKFIYTLDNIINKANPLKEDIIVYRGVQDLFFNDVNLTNIDIQNRKINILNIGQKFNDKAFTSFSILPSEKLRDDFKMYMKVKIPKGTKAQFIESYSGIKNYKQNELLVGRNQMFEVTKLPVFDEKLNAFVLEATLVLKDTELDKMGLNNINEINQNLKYYNRYESDKNDIDIKTFSEIFKKGGLEKYYRDAIEIVRANKLYNFNIPEHNFDHAQRVLLNALYLGRKMDLSDKSMDLLSKAAILHDSGRFDLKTDANHAKLGAEKAAQVLKCMDFKDIDKIRAIIEYHEGAETQEIFNNICDKYEIAIEDRGEILKMAKILRDSDGLDFARFPGALDRNKLRFEESKNLTKVQYQMQELRAKDFIDEIYSKYRVEIDKLRTNGVSDYEISFFFKYRTSSFPVVKRIENILNS